MKKNSIRLRHDPAHCLAPGLFQSFKRGERKGKNLDITYQFNENVSLRFVGFESLGADDMRILQGVVALAGLSKAVVDLDNPQGPAGTQLSLLMEPKYEAIKENAAALKTTLQRLMLEVGYKTDGGEKREDVVESLRRLASVTTYVRNDKKEWACHLLSYYFDEKTGCLIVAVNPRITKAIMGDNAYTHIDMREVRALSSDPTRILHQRLCAVIDPGKQRPVRLDTLISYVWTEPAEGSTLRMRRQAIRSAIQELIETGGWLFTETPGGAYLVARRKAGYDVPPAAVAQGQILLK